MITYQQLKDGISNIAMMHYRPIPSESRLKIYYARLKFLTPELWRKTIDNVIDNIRLYPREEFVQVAQILEQVPNLESALWASKKLARGSKDELPEISEEERRQNLRDLALILNSLDDDKKMPVPEESGELARRRKDGGR